MGSRLNWYKRCPADWQSGTRKHGMSFELRGFYSECLDVMWELQDQLPKDPKNLSMLLGTNPRMVRALIPKLIDLGKLVETEIGYYNPRMMADILGVESVPVDGPFAPHSPATDAPIASESRPKIRKNPTKTTREVRTDTEAEEDTEKNTKPASVESGTPRDVLAGPIDPMIADLIGWMSYGDERTARQWLSNTIRACGQEPTNDAYAKLKTELATGSLIARPIQTWSKIAQRMRDEAKRKAASSAGYGYVDHKVSSSVVRYAKPDMSDDGMVRKAVSHA